MRWRVLPIREFDRLASEWNTLSAAAGDLPFLRSEFLSPALREFGSGNEIFVTCGSGDGHCAMGILKRRRPGMWETFQPSQLPLGAFLLREGTPVDGALEDLLRALPGLAVAVGLTQQDPAILARPPSPSRRNARLHRDGHAVALGHIRRLLVGARQELRHNIKRQRAKLQEQAVPLTLDVIDTPDRVAAAIADYGRLEGSAGRRWRERR